MYRYLRVDITYLTMPSDRLSISDLEDAAKCSSGSLPCIPYIDVRVPLCPTVAIVHRETGPRTFRCNIFKSTTHHTFGVRSEHQTSII